MAKSAAAQKQRNWMKRAATTSTGRSVGPSVQATPVVKSAPVTAQRALVAVRSSPGPSSVAAPPVAKALPTAPVTPPPGSRSAMASSRVLSLAWRAGSGSSSTRLPLAPAGARWLSLGHWCWLAARAHLLRPVVAALVGPLSRLRVSAHVWGRGTTRGATAPPRARAGLPCPEARAYLRPPSVGCPAAPVFQGLVAHWALLRGWLPRPCPGPPSPGQVCLPWGSWAFHSYISSLRYRHQIYSLYANGRHYDASVVEQSFEKKIIVDFLKYLHSSVACPKIVDVSAAVSYIKYRMVVICI